MAESILVTGGAGFIGSHLVERLLARGKTVQVLDNLSTGRLDNLAEVSDHPNLTITVDNIMNWPVMEGLVAQVDQVIHLAAAVGVRKILDEPVETITTNVRGTEIVLDCCHRHNTTLFVASTSEIYGKAGDRLHEEHDRVLGSTTHRRWSYACTKTLDEFLALAYNYDKGLPVIIGRFFNTVGPRQTGQWGMVLPTFVGQALRGEPITVYGTGEQSRCFCHVADSIEAVQGLMDNPSAVGEVFNIGHEEEITIRGLAERVKERTGSDSPIRVIPYDEAYESGFEDMLRRQPDTTKVRMMLDWAPTHDINGIIDSVVEHFRGMQE
ncbi:NAD-dependent epimerase/dehydratase family protein [Gemmatimonadota bacterium]